MEELKDLLNKIHVISVATVDKKNKPHADQKYVAITVMAENFVVRLEGKAQVVDELDYIFKNNPEAKEHEDNKENMVTFKITYDLATQIFYSPLTLHNIYYRQFYLY